MVRELIGFLIGILTTAFVFRMFNLDLETAATFVPSIVVAVAAAIALSINKKALEHQKELRRWEINKGPLLRLAIALSDAISSTDSSIATLHAGHGDRYDEGSFTRLRTSLQHALDVHVTLLGPQVAQAITTYKEVDKEIQEAWDADAIDLIGALERSSRILKELLRTVNSSIKEHAAL